MNQKEIDKVNKRFDKQIKGDSLKDHPPKPWFKIDKELFNLSLNLTLDDWREIRKGDFWETLDSMQYDLDKKIYTLKKVKEYLYF